MAFLVTKNKSAALRTSHLPKVVKLPDHIVFGLLFENKTNYDDLNLIIGNHMAAAEATGQLALLKFIIDDQSAKAAFDAQRDRFYADIEKHLRAIDARTHCFAAYLGDGELALLLFPEGDSTKAFSDYRSLVVGLIAGLKKQYDFEIAAGLASCSAPFSSEIRRAHQTAGQAIRMGYGIWQRHYVYSLDDFDLIPAAYSGINSEMVKKSRSLVSRLSRHGDLLNTLSVFFKQDMNLTAAALALKVHRNTVLYRFSKIIELTDGLDPRNFDDALQLRLAIVINRLYSQHD